MPNSRLRYLFIAQMKKTASEAEKAELLALASSPASAEELNALVDEALNNESPGYDLNDSTSAVILSSILEINTDTTQKQTAIPVPSHKVHFIKTPLFRYAAIFLLMLGAGIYFWSGHQRLPADTLGNNEPVKSIDILPGKEGAILTLADGSTIVLDSINNGMVASQSGSNLILNDGQLVYNPNQETQTAAVFNTITIPKGRQFKLVLPDGTRVWLNAASSLRYPTSFSGSSRSVEIKGEAYFEVAKDKNKPFFVDVNNALVEVIGTSFNINSYSDEPVTKITLLEGSVKVSSPDEASKNTAIVMEPDQQVQLNPQSGKMTLKRRVNTNEVIAWKNGLILFEQSDLASIMRQVSRWYNVEVNYETAVDERIFTGEISRSMNVSELLKILSFSDVHFRIEDSTITVLP